MGFVRCGRAKIQTFKAKVVKGRPFQQGKVSWIGSIQIQRLLQDNGRVAHEARGAEHILR